MSKVYRPFISLFSIPLLFMANIAQAASPEKSASSPQFIAPIPISNAWLGYLIGANSQNHIVSKLNSTQKSKPILESTASKQTSLDNAAQNYDHETALNNSEGFILFANGKIYRLDNHGNELAKQVIQYSLKPKGFYVKVTGKLEGNTIIVDKLVELVDAPETNF